jgi:hypothetical protein
MVEQILTEAPPSDRLAEPDIEAETLPPADTADLGIRQEAQRKSTGMSPVPSRNRVVPPNGSGNSCRSDIVSTAR